MVRGSVGAGETPRRRNRGNGPRGTPLSDRRAKQVARASAWLLLAAVAVSVFSGWGITRTGIVHSASFGLVDRGLANTIHRGTQLPMALFFLVHVLANVRAAIHSRPTRRRLADSGLVLLALLLLALVVYMEYWVVG